MTEKLARVGMMLRAAGVAPGTLRSWIEDHEYPMGQSDHVGRHHRRDSPVPATAMLILMKDLSERFGIIGKKAVAICNQASPLFYDEDGGHQNCLSVSSWNVSVCEDGLELQIDIASYVSRAKHALKVVN